MPIMSLEQYFEMDSKAMWLQTFESYLNFLTNIYVSIIHKTIRCGHVGAFVCNTLFVMPTFYMGLYGVLWMSFYDIA